MAPMWPAMQGGKLVRVPWVPYANANALALGPKCTNNSIEFLLLQHARGHLLHTDAASALVVLQKLRALKEHRSGSSLPCG